MMVVRNMWRVKYLSELLSHGDECECDKCV